MNETAKWWVGLGGWCFGVGMYWLGVLVLAGMMLSHNRHPSLPVAIAGCLFGTICAGVLGRSFAFLVCDESEDEDEEPTVTQETDQ